MVIAYSSGRDDAEAIADDITASATMQVIHLMY